MTPCRHGHTSPRAPSDGRCVECRRASRRASYARASEEKKQLAVSRAVAWNREHPERRREFGRNWYAKHGDTLKERMYGMPRGQMAAMREAQQGRCKICNLAKPLVVDHCHDETERVRGLLCQSCNRGIGLLQDSVQILRAAADYVENT